MARYVTFPLAAEQDVVVVIMKFLRCGKICMSQYQLQQHKRTHNAKQLGSMACPHCDRTFQVVNAVGLLLIFIHMPCESVVVVDVVRLHIPLLHRSQASTDPMWQPMSLAPFTAPFPASTVIRVSRNNTISQGIFCC